MPKPSSLIFKFWFEKKNGFGRVKLPGLIREMGCNAVDSHSHLCRWLRVILVFRCSPFVSICSYGIVFVRIRAPREDTLRYTHQENCSHSLEPQLLCCSNRLDSQSLHQLLCKKSIALCGTLVQLNSNRRNKYTLFDGLTSNTYGGEAKCLLVFKVKPLNEGFISLFLFYFLVFCLLVFEILPTTLYRPTLLHGGHIDWIKCASKTKSTEAKPL